MGQTPERGAAQHSDRMLDRKIRYAEELQPYVKMVKLIGMLLAGGFMAHL